MALKSNISEITDYTFSIITDYTHNNLKDQFSLEVSVSGIYIDDTGLENIGIGSKIK